MKTSFKMVAMLLGIGIFPLCAHAQKKVIIEDEYADRFEFTYDMKQLYRVIHSIPEEMKVPFQMFVAGFKYREIAEKLGLPMGTVKSRLFFIRKRLKEELKDFSS